jgi:Carboxypeptidase regulatory-like domain
LKHGFLLCLGALLASAAGVSVGVSPAAAQTNLKASSGILSGDVRDDTGIPQLGATVEIFSEALGASAAHQLLTNTQGLFQDKKLTPGLYTVRVTLAGYLPSLERHVRITSNITTSVRIQLQSMFASIEEMRRPPASGAADPDDWRWVLRSASAVRPVLQWHESDESVSNNSIVVETSVPAGPRGRVEVSDGARRPGSVSNIGAVPGTEFAYDQRIDQSNHIVFAGQVSYNDELPAGGIAAIWLPTAAGEDGPHTTVVLREAKIGPLPQSFRGIRFDQSSTLRLGERSLVRVGGEYVLVGLGASAWSLRPRVKWETQLAPGWYVDAIYAALPTGIAPSDDLGPDPNRMNADTLSSALNELDAFPALLWHGGRPVLENGRHEEVSVEHRMGENGVLQLAAFHDDSTHTAIFGRGIGLPADDFFQDPNSRGFAYDGGAASWWGSRAVFREKVSDDLELTAIYAFSGAIVPIVPTSEMDGVLRDLLHQAQRQSISGGVNARIPRTGTHLNAAYKWISGTAISRIDPYGETLYQTSPYLHVGIRQPLPRWAFGRWEANAECDNLLAQGYVTVNTLEGQVLLVPAFRSFRGGLSLQF